MRVRSAILTTVVVVAIGIGAAAWLLLHERREAAASTPAPHASATAPAPANVNDTPPPAIAPRREKSDLAPEKPAPVTVPEDLAPVPPETRPDSAINGANLRVVDRATHVDLTEVTIIDYESDWPRDFGIPWPTASMTPCVDHAASPLVLARPHGDFDDVALKRNFWIRARDHAWRLFNVDFTTTATQQVELGAAATLVVVIEGELPERPDTEPAPDHATANNGGAGVDRSNRDSIRNLILAGEPHLRLRRPAGREHGPVAAPSLGMIFAERLAELGEEHFDGIEPGEVTASVEIGDQSLSPLIAGIVRTTLIAGQTTKLTLHLDPMRMPAAVAVAGTLFVPAEWMATRAADDCALYIAPLDLSGRTGADERCLAVADMAAQPGRPGWYRWDAGELLAATYQFMMPRVGFSRVVKIEPPRQDSLEFVVAEPALLHVRVVSEASGAPLHPWSLQWIPEPPEGSTQAGDPIELEPDDAMAVYSAHVPVGAGRVVCMIDHGCVLDDDSATAVIHSGEQELTVRAHPGCGVALEGLEHGTPVDWPDEFADDVRVEAVGHSGRGAAIGAAGSQLLVVVTAPGSYRVTLPTLPDCVPIAPFVVDVPAGEFVKRTVELTRK